MIPVKINWHEVPFLRILLPFLLGILLRERLDWGIFPQKILPGSGISLVFLLLVLHLSKTSYKWRWVFGVGFTLLLIISGYTLHDLSDQRKSSLHYSKHAAEEAVLIGQVSGLSIRQNKLRAEVEISGLVASDWEVQKAVGKLHLYIPVPSNSVKPKTGDLLLFRGLMQAVEGPKNPYVFDYQTYLRRRNIHFQVFADSGQWMILKAADGMRIKRLLTDSREKLLQILAKHLPEAETYGVASALILGYKEATPEDLATAFAATGATHVLAVSGLHVGIVQLILAKILGFFGKRRKKMDWFRTILLILGVWAFALLTGGAGSALRAATMFSLLALGRVLNRGSSPYNALAASAFLLIFPGTWRIFDVGFQLSYLAVVGIVFYFPVIHKLWFIPNRFGDYLWQLTVLSLAATLVTAPISMMYFHQFPVYFWLSSLVAVPLSGIILGLGILLLTIHWIPYLAEIIGWSLNFAIVLLNESIRTVEGMPFHLISGIWISEAGNWALYFALSAIALGIGLRNFKWILVALGILFIVCFFHASSIVARKNQKEIILYHARGNTVLDCVDGQKVFCLSKVPVSQQTMKFSIQNYHWNRRVSEQCAFLMHETPGAHGNWYYKSGILEFHGIRIAVVEKDFRKAPPEKLKTDYLILHNNPDTRIETLIQTWDIEKKLIIIDSSNKRNKVADWKKECAALRLNYHDIATAGAWRLTLKYP
jgi:competence protein ComEC